MLRKEVRAHVALEQVPEDARPSVLNPLWKHLSPSFLPFPFEEGPIPLRGAPPPCSHLERQGNVGEFLAALEDMMAGDCHFKQIQDKLESQIIAQVLCPPPLPYHRPFPYSQSEPFHF